MKNIRASALIFMLIGLMVLGCVLYISALSVKIKPYHTSQPAEAEVEVQDEERLPSIWDDPEYWKNPWVL